MIRTLYRHRSGTVIGDFPANQLASAAKDPQTRLWIDMANPTAEESNWIFREIYHFHPLAIEDAVKDSHVPKLDDYGQYLYLVFHTLVEGEEPMDIHTEELDVILGANFLITMHEDTRQSIEKLSVAESHHERGLARGPAFLLYELLNEQVDGYTSLLDNFEAKLEKLGDRIFLRQPKTTDDQLNAALTAQSSALRVHRVLTPQRDLFHRLAHSDYAVVPAEVRIYFQDLYDDLARLASLAESMRDLARSTIDTYQALINTRLNEVMRMLTVISTIFMPLGFLAGVYGMNVELPGQHSNWFFYFLCLIFLGIAVGMFWLFRRNRWLH